MPRSLSQADPPGPEDVRFQVSLLRLLYPGADSSPQVFELEGLLNLPANLAPAR
jgi:hypothetical protein